MLVSRRLTLESLPAAVRAEPLSTEPETSMRALPALARVLPTPCHWPVPMSGMLVPSLATALSTFSHWPLPPTMVSIRLISATPATPTVAPSRLCSTLLLTFAWPLRASVPWAKSAAACSPLALITLVLALSTPPFLATAPWARSPLVFTPTWSRSTRAVLLARAPRAFTPLVVTEVLLALSCAPDSACKPWERTPWVLTVESNSSSLASSAWYWRLTSAPGAWSPWVSTLTLWAIRLTGAGLSLPIPAYRPTEYWPWVCSETPSSSMLPPSSTAAA
ncbi:hypothetical protein D3C77_179790 [compost metagenome]